MQSSFADGAGLFCGIQSFFADMQGSFADMQGSFADMQGSLADMQCSFVHLLRYIPGCVGTAELCVAFEHLECAR